MCLVEWISVYSELMWTIPLGDRSIEKRFRKKFVENVFVTTPVTFYSNLPNKSWFWWSRQGGDDLGRNILNLMCSNGPRWWVDAQGYLKRALIPPRSILRSKTVLNTILQSVVLKLRLTVQIQTDMVGVNVLYRPSPNLISPQKNT